MRLSFASATLDPRRSEPLEYGDGRSARSEDTAAKQYCDGLRLSVGTAETCLETSPDSSGTAQSSNHLCSSAPGGRQRGGNKYLQRCADSRASRNPRRRERCCRSLSCCPGIDGPVSRRGWPGLDRMHFLWSDRATKK